MAITQSVFAASSSPGFQTAVGYGVTTSPPSLASSAAGFQTTVGYGVMKTVSTGVSVATPSSSVQTSPKTLVGQIFPKLR